MTAVFFPDGPPLGITPVEARALVRAKVIAPTIGEGHYGPVGDHDYDSIGDWLSDYYDDIREDRMLRGEPEDTPCLEDGRDNCNDAGTGEGQYHGRM